MLYSDSDMAQSKKALKGEMLVVFVLLAAGLALMITGLVFRIKFLSIAGIVFFSMLAFFWFDMKALPWRKYVGFLLNINSGRAHEVDGVVEVVDDAVRQSEEGVAIRDVCVRTGDKAEETLFYWDEAKPMPDIIGRNVHITAYGRYIIGITQK